MLKLVLFAKLRNMLMIFLTAIKYAISLLSKEFENDTKIRKLTYCKNAEINMHVLKTWIIE